MVDIVSFVNCCYQIRNCAGFCVCCYTNNKIAVDEAKIAQLVQESLFGHYLRCQVHAERYHKYPHQVASISSMVCRL